MTEIADRVLCAGGAVQLAGWSIRTCWPEDAGPLITWGLVHTQGPTQPR